MNVIDDIEGHGGAVGGGTNESAANLERLKSENDDLRGRLHQMSYNVSQSVNANIE